MLLCCFVRKGGRGPGEREKRQRAGNAGKGKERREASAAGDELDDFDCAFKDLRLRGK